VKVAILIQQPISLFELGYAVELFALPQTRYSNWYETEVVSFSPGPHSGIGGISLEVRQVDSLDGFDMLVVPAWPFRYASVSESMATAITQLHQRGGRILTFCTGAFLLGELGLFDGKRATTHWAYAEEFQRRYPAAQYIDNVLYLYDGVIGCSAGSAAGIDLSMEVIRADFGYQIANQVARRLVMPPHRCGGQSQFVERPMIKTPNRFANAVEWAQNNLQSKIDMDQLAQHALMSRRSFDRKFRAAFTLSPQQWLIQQRLNVAKDLLESTEYSIDQIANLSGFENAVSFRHHFKKTLTLSPRQFRDQFGSLSRKALVV
jgi:AraC family transcriptional activator FtrA